MNIDPMKNEEHTRRRCGAKTRQGTLCRRGPMPNGRCWKHGGASLSGMAHPNYIHGRFSKGMPRGLNDDYVRALSDPNLIALRDEAALLDARIVQILGRLEEGESQTRWRRAGEAMAAFRKAQADRDVAAANDSLVRLAEVIDAGRSDYDAWSDLLRVVDRKRKIADTETKRLLRKHDVMTRQSAYLMMRAVLDSVRAHVTDRSVLANVARDLEQLSTSSIVNPAAAAPTGR